ncbi:MAG: 23S rRNA (uracil(1939)-C(5))-methyltransferase RlmD [Bacteroidia bacterium]|nr:23S rRNA (uracil(1939)-C(5))-methyltransferase RlmD [Bacteroidia bacterium]
MRTFKERKPLPLFENIVITTAAAEGKAMARIDDLVVFVDNAVPGDVADLQLTMKKKNYAEAKAIKFHTYSEERATPMCEHFGVCGGCKWQHMQYVHQLKYKHQQVIDNFDRLGKFPYQGLQPIVGAEVTSHYRNKLEFTFTNFRWLDDADMLKKKEGYEIPKAELNALGFHIPKKFDKAFHINKCHLQADPSNGIRNFIYAYAQENEIPFFDLKFQNGYLRTLMIRTTTLNQVMIVLMVADDKPEWLTPLLDAVHMAFPSITSLQYTINTKRNDSYEGLIVQCHKGNDYIVEQLGNLKFKISAKSFFQTNTAQANVLYAITKDFAGLTGNEVVYDLYTGTGTIANYVADKASKVVGVEYVEDAVKDAYVNSDYNKITNTSFFAGDMKDVLNDEFIAIHGKPDVVITDPPRAGMHADVVNTILRMQPQKVVYVSCNPATQARDIALMQELYTVTRVQPVDMFPHTHHVENVALLELK